VDSSIIFWFLELKGGNKEKEMEKFLRKGEKSVNHVAFLSFTFSPSLDNETAVKAHADILGDN